MREEALPASSRMLAHAGCLRLDMAGRNSWNAENAAGTLWPRAVALGIAIAGYHSTGTPAAAPTLSIAAGCAPAAIKCNLTPSKT